MEPLYKLALFDLDGTISDPALGVYQSINYALEHFGFASIHRADIGRYIGPPLDQSFQAITGIDSAMDLKAMVGKFRERYGEIGYAENELYPGIFEVLKTLSGRGMPMAVCTSKRVDFAERILAMFDLRSCFRFVSGGDVGIQKWEQVATLRAEGRVPDGSIMIGDRAIDVVAGHRNGLAAAGVLWGHGQRKELEQEQPRYLVSVPEELPAALYASDYMTGDRGALWGSFS